MPPKSLGSAKFKFRKNDRVGDPSAELDQFLSSCFIDTGDLAILQSCQDPRAIVAGRTGSGKSALLRRMQEQCEHVINIDLHELALHYISGSTILTFFEEELGVKLDHFYQFLWRHVFVVGLLKRHYNIQDESTKQQFFDRITSRVFNKGRLEAFRYLNKYGSQFWISTEVLIKEITTIIEQELSANAGLQLSQLATLQAGGKLSLSENQSREVKRRGDQIVNSVQMSKLSTIIDALDDDILTDPKRRYYIIVDSLDEPWVDERLRPWLIRGLIETVRYINRQVRHIKIIVAMRVDLLHRIYKLTSDAGFQEEKYTALNLPVSWTKHDLCDLLDQRVHSLVRQRYTHQSVGLEDILPKRMGKHKDSPTGTEYLLDRTLLRPRDAIQFLNACLEQAVEEPVITIQMLQRAEAKYSQQRRTALADEWSQHYPYLILMTDLLKNRSAHFRLGDITRGELDTIALRLTEAEKLDPKLYGKDVQQFQAYFNSAIQADALRAHIAQWFYTIGLIGVKLAPSHEVLWSCSGGPIALNSAEVNDEIVIHVHKTFWRVLGIQEAPN